VFFKINSVEISRKKQIARSFYFQVFQVLDALPSELDGLLDLMLRNKIKHGKTSLRIAIIYIFLYYLKLYISPSVREVFL